MSANVHRLFVERKNGFENEAKRTLAELTRFVGITSLTGIRYFNRYDLEGIDDETAKRASREIFSEPQSDIVHFETLPLNEGETLLPIEYLPGQYDQRADSAAQCLALISGGKAVTVRCARVFALSGKLTEEDLGKIRSYLINPVDSREAAREKPATLALDTGAVTPVETVKSFISWKDTDLDSFRARMGLAMDGNDIRFLQSYFKGEGRDPTETEIRVLDTYWSDHCRHTTFNTVLEKIDIESGPYEASFKKALETYTSIRKDLYAGKDKKVSLMDMAVIGAKALKKKGLLNDIEESAEINACSLYIDAQFRGPDGNIEKTEPWLLMFKNETHNHPTEIEPFGGAATCIGGAIRDPLSGRAWVYQALRVTGAADPRAPIEATLPGKLPQIKLTREAAAGFSAYGNQIGLTTGQVVEFYDPGFLAKRMELGAVIAATPVSSVVREEPEAGDLIIMVGGGTGRDGIGGATGSSKAHTKESVTTAGAEVQKGNPVEERKIQRLFRNGETTRLIRRCNDFGAGGVAVAVGELAAGLTINLDAVPKKYEGLNGTELAISESQERMAVVVRAKDAQAFMDAAHAENLNAAVIAEVTTDKRLVMTWRGQKIVDIDRTFLDTSGSPKSANALIRQPGKSLDYSGKTGVKGLAERWINVLQDLPVASQRGLTERFDGSIGSASVLFPMGGAWQATPECGMAARLPVEPGKDCATVSLMTMGYDPKAANWSPFHASQFAVLESLVKILALGGDPATARLSFQEYFERTSSPEAWGKPAAALLGALAAQMGAGTAAIGGKDSMSGTFHDINVPPTLVSFAVATAMDTQVRGGSFTKAGNGVYLALTPYKTDNTPDWDGFNALSRALVAFSRKGSITAAYPVVAGGLAAALSKMAFGNRIGLTLDQAAITSIPLPALFTDGPKDELAAYFAPLYGALVLECADKPDIPCIRIGTTTNEAVIRAGSEVIPLDTAQIAWEKPLAAVFPPVTGIIPQANLPSWATEQKPKASPPRPSWPAGPARAKPLAIIPVFPGTNCEYDMARAFTLAGAQAKILVLRNRTTSDLAQSLAELEKAINEGQILAFSGGFSAGDEPDGSAKFIANIIREEKIARAIEGLLDARKGLILGICNGFQALIKTGLLPYGKIREPSAEMPTLTYNTIGRHISRFARTRMGYSASPWAQGDNLLQGKIHVIPLSHGEGRVIIDESLAKNLFENGQVFSQYVDQDGNPTMLEPDNPNGSQYAIEGMTDSSGLILGKMGHSERPIDPSGLLFRNIPGDTCQNIFAAGVRYFV